MKSRGRKSIWGGRKFRLLIVFRRLSWRDWSWWRRSKQRVEDSRYRSNEKDIEFDQHKITIDKCRSLQFVFRSTSFVHETKNSPLWRYLREVCIALWISLYPQRGGQDELTHSRAEPESWEEVTFESVEDQKFERRTDVSWIWVEVCSKNRVENVMIERAKFDRMKRKKRNRERVSEWARRVSYLRFRVRLYSRDPSPYRSLVQKTTMLDLFLIQI